MRAVSAGDALSFVGVSMRESPAIAPQTDDPADPLAALSKRQRLIAIRFSEGLTYREIGDSLHIAPSTVRTHLAAIYRKLAIRKKTTLVNMVAGHLNAVRSEIHPAPVAAVAVDGKAGSGVSPLRELMLPIEPSIAVLPFLDFTSNGDHGVEADGLTEDLTTAISQIRGLFVTARNSAFLYKSRKLDVKRIAHELGVRYVIDGSLRRVGSGFRVSAQLIDGTSGHHLWADTYDIGCDGFDEEQDSIVRGIAASVQTRITLHEGDALPLRTRGPPSAHELLKRALNLVYQFTPEALDEAARLAGSALEQSPNSDRAHQVLALALYAQAALGYAVDWHANVEQAHEAAERAIELFEADEYNHCACGFALMLKRDHERAVAEFARALEINPSCSVAYGGLAAALAWGGRSEQAIFNNEIACRSDPRNPSIFFRFFVTALAHFTAQRYQEAAVWATQALRRKRLYKSPHLLRVAALAQADELAQADRLAITVRSQFPDVDRAFVGNLPFIRPIDRQNFVRGLELAGVLA